MKLELGKMSYSLGELSPLEAACVLHGLQILAECLSDKIAELKKEPAAEAAVICVQTRRVRDRVITMTEAILDAMGKAAEPHDDDEGVRYQTSARYDEEV